MHKKILLTSTPLSAVLFSCLSSVGLAADIVDPGTLGSQVRAAGIAGDGSVVVGVSQTTGNRAFRWTSADGMQDLGLLPSGTFSDATGISSDGSTIVGFADIPAGYRSFVWTSGGGMVNLGTLAGGSYSSARDVSADGSVVIGYSDSASGSRAYRWTSGGSMEDLGVLTGGTRSEGNAVSDDGSVVAGYSTVTGGDEHAFRWTSGGGMVDLGVLAGGISSRAEDISADGSVVVGYGTGGGTFLAFRWTSGGGMESLGTIPGETTSYAHAASSDGSVIVGRSGLKAFRWNSTDGMTSLETDLQAAGVDTTGWTLAVATGVSADGQTIIGNNSAATSTRIFIARFGAGGAALVTPEGMQQSATSASALTNAASTLGTTLSSNTMITVNQSSIRQSASPATKTASLSQGEAVYVEDEDINYFAARGYTGVSKKLSADWSIGGGAIVGYDKDTSLYQGGEATTKAWGGDLHVSYKPKGSNLTANVVFTGLRLHGDLKRGYLNGATPEKASGETDGFYVDLGARVGYEMMMGNDWSLTPFGEYHYSHTRYDAYSETPGTLAGRVSEQTTRSQNLQGGLSLSYAGLGNDLILWAEGAAGMAREEIDTPTVTVSGVGTFGGADVLDSYAYGKATVGLRYALNENTSLNASLGGIAELGGNSTKDIDNIQTTIGVTYSF